MRIVDRKTLATMPNGTVFCGYTPDSLDGDFEIITGHNEKYDGVENKVGFYSTLSLSPFIDHENKCTVGTERITNWATVDTCDYDFDEDQLFAVFSKTEVRAMITVLQYALSDCGFSISKFMDTYFYKDEEIDEKDLEDWTDD